MIVKSDNLDTIKSFLRKNLRYLLKENKYHVKRAVATKLRKEKNERTIQKNKKEQRKR